MSVIETQGVTLGYFMSPLLGWLVRGAHDGLVTYTDRLLINLHLLMRLFRH
jgi:hypothetical protein